MTIESSNLLTALGQWRDSLVNLTGRNRLLNYRPTRSSTIEFTGASAAEIYATIASPQLTFVTGTKPPEKAPSETDDLADGLEELVLDEITAFDYDSYPDSLFADMTQRNVDRALKNMSAVAKREYLDKGLSTLYVAFGALRWVDDSGDQRKSPLILVPASLDSLGSRQPLHLTFSEDDISVNPALGIKLAEYGIELPPAETVIEAVQSDGIEGALSQFRSIELPDDWIVEDFSTMSNFMFAKEAMYRDLLDNEERILGHEILQAVAGDVAPEESQLVFDEINLDEIDSAAPPEQTPLILDADASQRAAILAATAGKSFVMDGPPGTGKSQTIANMIGTLVAEGKTVLFVSEKIVALEVVRDRLSTRGLDPFSLELHSHKAVRSEVARKLGRALQTKPVAPPTPAPERLQQAHSTRSALSDYAMAMNEIRHPLRLSMFDVLGRTAALESTLAPPPANLNTEQFDPVSLNRLTALLERLKRHWDTALEGDRALWAGLQKQHPPVFEFQTALDALKALQALEPATAQVANELGLADLGSVERLLAVLQSWNGRPARASQDWLQTDDLEAISTAIEAHAKRVNELELAEMEANEVGGKEWRVLPSTEFEVPKDRNAWSQLQIDRDELTAARLSTIGKYLTTASSLLAGLQSTSQTLAEQLGLTQPQTPNQYRSFVQAVAQLLGDAPPLTAWLTDEEGRKRAEHGLNKLHEAVDAENHAENEATVIFSEDVLALNLDELLEQLPSRANWTKRLTREYRNARSKLLAIAVPTADKRSVVSGLQAAVAWRNARQSLADSTTKYASALGQYFDGRNTNWDLTKQALRGAETVTNSVQVASASILSTVLADQQSIKMLRPVQHELERNFQQWVDLESDDGDSIAPLNAPQPIADSAANVAALALETNLLKEYLDQFSHHLGPDITVGAAIKAAKACRLAEIAKRKVEDAAPTLASTLNVPVEDVPRSGDELAELRGHLLWVTDFRAMLDRPEGDGQSASPFTKEQLAALNGAHIPSALQTAIRDWVGRRDTVLSNFGEERCSDLAEDLADYRAAIEVLNEFVNDHDSAADWTALQNTIRDLRELGLSAPLDYAISTRVSAGEIADYLMKSVYEAWFSTLMESDPRLAISSAIDRDTLIERFRELDRELSDAAISTIVESATQRRPRSTAGQGGVILREAEKKRKHIPVRELISRARDVIQSIHPCFMMSPLAVSQYLPPDIEFDVVIFDEASQVSPGDAINCIYRGKALITVGDQKQLPPTSFFTTNDDSDDDSDDENLAADYESILDLMKATGNFTSLTLRWHYRSRHEDLISFSNASFYEGRLITFPGAISESDRYGVKFHKVEGIYRRSTGRDNPIEAKYVAQRVVHHFDTRPDASLGVVAFSSAQRDTIENAISLARSERPDLDGYFQDDRVDGFFVKSLESVQGDERDVIIFSVGYGPDEMGKFHRHFGPVNRSGGQRRLNVAVTRARELVEIVSSVSAADIGEVTSEGARHLRRYLDFAERGPAALALELGPSGLGTDSPFEDSVIDAIRSWGYDVQPQVGVAGYRIDIGVKHPNAPGSFMLGVECDGAMYHSSRAARDRDRLRHEILEGLGWHLHHIWGTAWYRNRAKEEERLRVLLEQLAQERVTTRVTKRGSTRQPAPIELLVETDDIDEIPAWVVEYAEASPNRIPSWLDLGEPGGHRHLIDFVRDVVATEAPVHIDLVAQRLRAASAIGRLGARIQRNLEAAISKADATFDGRFVRANSPGPLAVRAPSALTDRTVDQLPPEELSEAIIGVVRDARGIGPEEATAHVAAIFGWRRRGSIIAGQLGSVVQQLCDDGRLILTTGGLRVP